MIDAIRATLSDWDAVKIERLGDIVVIGGKYGGATYAGARADGEALARDLDRIAKEAAAPPCTIWHESSDGAGSGFDVDGPPVFEPNPEWTPNGDGWSDNPLGPFWRPKRMVPEPEPEPAPEPQSFEQLASAGTMLLEDELTIRRGLAWAKISTHAEVLIEALTDPNRRVELVQQIAMIANKRQLGIALSADDMAAESGFVALQAQEDDIRRFERQMRQAVQAAGLDMLREFDVQGAGWPAKGET